MRDSVEPAGREVRNRRAEPCADSWRRSATRLHVHVNTLRYRIRRIEDLTGRDLGTLEDRVDFFLALRATRPASSL
ncbi:PucR family transcriptional regulator [Actinomadura geliboluensis]|uniref:PucR family transcriptional regulator n=1 Tax=Actinomadura geliboluensis TaxID=882440 RepID=A0A5S4H5W1_9ACTN|nr:PucR family transcriptional regulator [Actinomadura geliboluensis]